MQSSCCFLVGILLLVSTAIGQEAVVFVVHRSNPVEDISQQELAAIYSGQTTRWPDGQKIIAVDQTLDAVTRTVIYRALHDAPPTKQFSLPGSPAPFKPTVRQSDRSVVQLISRLPNAIGYVELGSVNERVKALTVDGAAPGDAEYPLNAAGGR